MAPRRPDSEEEFHRKRRVSSEPLEPEKYPDDYSDLAVTKARAEANRSDHITPSGERYEQNILDRSLEAQRRIKGGQTWTDWEAIAEAVRVITSRVMADTGTDNIQADAFKKTFGKAWRAHESLVSNEKNYRPITRQEIHDLRFLLDHPEVTAWRAQQKPQRQRRLLHPRTVIAGWKAGERRKNGEPSTGKKGPAPRRASNVESSINTIVDYARDLAADEKRAIITRIAEAIGLAITQPKPASKRKRK